MDQGCVDCHNAHPDSPKTDWRVGDVRGVQVVQIPLDALTMNLDFESALVTGLIILITFTATIALLFLDHRASRAQIALQRRNKELFAARERADHASRAKSDFLANMSHEIRTPLNGVIGMMQTLDPTDFDQQTRDTFGLMKRSAQSLQTIVNNILDISKIEARKVEVRHVEFNMVALLNELADRFAVSFSGRNTQFHLDIDPDVPSWVHGDGDKVEQILSNLISNAHKFTVRGEVRLSARLLDKAPVGAGQTTMIRFAVSDTGIGIAPEEAELLFKPFFQADSTLTRNHEGTGLGLAIVQELSALMGGEVKVDSLPGEGSVFTVDLPFKLGRRSAMPVAEKAERAPALLLLTQDRRDLHVMTEVILISGLDYVGFASPEQARAYWSQWCQSVKHVFVDAQFAGDGAAFIQWMTKTREDLAGCKFVLIGDEVDAARAVGASTMEKPTGRSAFSNYFLGLGYGGETIAGDQAMHGEHVYKTPDVVIDPLHVLIVDDNAINRRVLSRLLDQMGMTAETADDAASAIRRVEKGGIDLVLMDVQMPDMNGYEATAVLRARGFHDLEIVACTAHAFEADREKALECGMNGHLAKPVDRQILRNLLVGLSEKRRRRLAS